MADLLRRTVAITALLAVGASYVGWAQETKEHANRSQVVDFLNGQVGIPLGSPWCAAFVYHIGTAACWTPTKSYWPLPKTGGCAILGEFAASRKVLVEQPRVGDVFLLWHKVGTEERFAHTGVVTAISPDSAYQSLEGNTNTDGSRDGWGVFRRTRTIHPKDRFIRWIDLI
jgi:hypothetical protein